ncbi:hypothetical protein LIP_2177 [Limnochorda pilosa]|uniref:Uncharacterized protein n=1 Tax=Limnochorda pilosa TaxID=1555112 RepID=A0A0K2SLM3_LIMPI|nr:hypothetical protein LIP_2177 [Limnochorda pilosa]
MDSSPSREPFPPVGPCLVREAIAEVPEERDELRPRASPRVLKRAVLRYPPKRRKHENWPRTTQRPAEAAYVLK